ncbi:MAG: efflux transporter outer membrane subunit [Bacteroidetes bacterium]|nr:efflux transporter outer membrane subunit [Bacteroidota bacterium]
MTSSIIKSTAFVLLLGLGACKVSKDTATPQAELPTQFRNATTEDTSSVAKLPWKSFFGDATLQQLIDSAIVRNYDMQIALKSIESAQLVLGQSKLGYWPSVNFNATYGLNRPSDNSLNGQFAPAIVGKKYIEDYNANVGLSWEVPIWGKIKSQQEKALAGYLQTQEARKALQTNLVAGVAEGYYNLLMLDQQLAIAKKNLALNDSTLDIIRLQFKAGDVTALAIQQAEAQRLVAAQLVPQLEQGVILQENALSILTGKLPASISRTAQLDLVPLKDTLSAGVPAELVSRRPDVRSSELALNIANANVGLTKANLYPSLTITAQGGLNSFKSSNWFNIPGSLFGIVGGGLTQPLFNRKQLKTQYELAKVDRERTVLQFRQSVLVAVGEVSDALGKIEKLKAQQVVVSTRVNTLRQAITNANSLFKNGLATYLEVITAQGNVLQSELELASIKKGQLSAEVELYRSLGGGWN